MTIIEKMISESAEIEMEIRQAVEQGKLSKRSSLVLLDECIKMLVAVETRQIILANQANAQSGIVAPASVLQQ